MVSRASVNSVELGKGDCLRKRSRHRVKRSCLRQAGESLMLGRLASSLLLAIEDHRARGFGEVNAWRRWELSRWGWDICLAVKSANCWHA